MFWRGGISERVSLVTSAATALGFPRVRQEGPAPRRLGPLVTRLEALGFFVHGSCMKTITIDNDAYELLSSLKQDKGDSFTKVILRHVHKPCDTAGELLDYY